MADNKLINVVDNARASATVLDDPDELEDNAVYSWARHQMVLSSMEGKYALSSCTPPLRWQSRAKRFSSAADALTFVSRATHRTTDIKRIAVLLKTVGYNAPIKLTDVTKVASEAFAASELSLIPVMRVSHVGKASPSVYQALNGRYRTKVDFAFLSEWEGGQYLRGYIPFTGGVVAGASGMTIATGFDIGQIGEKQLKQYDLPASAVAQIKPFLNVKFGGPSSPLKKSMTKQEVAAHVAKLGPVPIISKSDAEAVDAAIHGAHLSSASDSWNAARKKSVPSFEELPEAWQTVLFSRTFHQGMGMPKTAVAKPFYAAATEGRWDDAVQALASYGVSQAWYKSRVAKETAHLKTQMPAPVPQAVKSAAAVKAP